MIRYLLQKGIIVMAFFVLHTPSGLSGQEQTAKFDFPDIPGYHTLVCDFHMHTVFSDGLVWPTVRIEEAIKEGLDAISITEHIEYQNSYLAGDHNQSFNIAKKRADKKGLILIKGAEITRSMPPGHFNAIFLEDANTLDVESWQDALRIANEQGAFVFWNHPGWRQPDEIPIWYEEHSWLLSKGWIQGIEIVNETSYYPLAHQWALDSNLCMLGNSDVHDALYMFFDPCNGEHRPVTLVFAKERTAEGIREALDNKRTAIYFKNSLYGNEEFLKPLFLASVTELVGVTTGAHADPVYCLQNNSSMTFELAHADNKGIESEPFLLSPSEIIESNSGFLNTYAKVIIKNVWIAPGKNIEIAR
ncbi:MAG: PHP domain-containing protein [Bacteroidota bacterium]